MDSAYNYYIKVKGRKFQIPFFDDNFLSFQFAPSSVKNPEEKLSIKKISANFGELIIY
jgi:hypothetical protein